MQAVSGDAGLITSMLQKGADPNLRNHIGASALMWAGDLESVGLLLNGGADANATSIWPHPADAGGGTNTEPRQS